MALVVPNDVINSINALRAPIVVAHVVPDADALGAMFAVAIAWASDQCTPKAALPQGSLSHRLAFLADWANVPTAGPDDFPAADGFVVVDTAKRPRCNVGAELRAIHVETRRTCARNPVSYPSP